MICTDETEAPGMEAAPAFGRVEAVALRSWMPRRGLARINRSYPQLDATVRVLTVLSKGSAYPSRPVCTYKITQ